MWRHFSHHTPQQGTTPRMLSWMCVNVCVQQRRGHFLGSGSNTNYSAIWWSAPSQSSLTLLSEETCCAQCHGFALWHMSFICTSIHARTHQFMCTCVCVCNRWEWQGIVRGGSAEMCFPARSLYPPVLTPLGDRPPGNKSRLSDTLHPCSATTTTTTTTTHTPSQQSTKKKEEWEEMGGVVWIWSLWKRILELWKEMWKEEPERGDNSCGRKRKEVGSGLDWMWALKHILWILSVTVKHSNLSDATKFTKLPHLVYFVYRMSLNHLVCWLKQANLVFCVFCDLLRSFSFPINSFTYTSSFYYFSPYTRENLCLLPVLCIHYVSVLKNEDFKHNIHIRA